MTRTAMSASEFDKYFDDGGDVTGYIVEGSETFPGREDGSRKINITMPAWMIDELDAMAKHLCVPRQAVINMWIKDRIDLERAKRTA